MCSDKSSLKVIRTKVTNFQFISVIGNCLFAYGRKLGELCRRDADCESGLVCDVSAVGGPSVCRAPMVIAKQYAEDCSTSSDCDITRQVFNLFYVVVIRLIFTGKLLSRVQDKIFPTV